MSSSAPGWGLGVSGTSTIRYKSIYFYKISFHFTPTCVFSKTIKIKKFIWMHHNGNLSKRTCNAKIRKSKRLFMNQQLSSQRIFISIWQVPSKQAALQTHIESKQKGMQNSNARELKCQPRHKISWLYRVIFRAKSWIQLFSEKI